ncbi:hypothetical protein jhhlp_000099 [Lomentospora prolificans]|uniref:Mitochondrial import receptor subunit tom22 n=1 Tax=Lomentospora prolificans TaxID=41688 RepID=A0A2N3NLP5_9PEZI|nr:hypothetical protein jhhlp_000099 [Lomentospora prolificans]
MASNRKEPKFYLFDYQCLQGAPEAINPFFHDYPPQPKRIPFIRIQPLKFFGAPTAQQIQDAEQKQAKLFELGRRYLTIPYFKRPHVEKQLLSRLEAHERRLDDIGRGSHSGDDDHDDHDSFVIVEHSQTDTMVQLTEVPDEHFETPQPGPVQEDDADYTDTDSEISTDSEFDPEEESLADRLYALRDIVPPTTRGWIASKVNSVVGLGTSSLWFTGKALWAISSTALLLGVPFAICVTEEQQVMAMEQEYKMREVGSEVLTAGGEQPTTADRVGAAIGSEGKIAL